MLPVIAEAFSNPKCFSQRMMAVDVSVLADGVANLDDLDEEADDAAIDSAHVNIDTATRDGDGDGGASPASASSSRDPAAPASDGSAGGSRVLSEAELTAIDSRRARMRRHADSAMDFRCDMAHLKRHETMMRILVSLVLAIIYFSVSYYLDFGKQERNLIVSPYEVRSFASLPYISLEQYFTTYAISRILPTLFVLRQISPVCVALVCGRFPSV
jgi:hypothetical protein